MREREPVWVGLVLTLFLHVFLGGLMIAKQDDAGCGGGELAVASNFESAETIEASLAFKKKEPESRQPQKQRKKKFKPNPEKAASYDAEKTPEKKEEKETLRPDKDEVDFESILDKNRKQDEELSDTGVDELPQEGAADGSEWGTETEARGDPYVGELKGRIYAAWKVPTLETGTGTAIGCVRLGEDGTIADRELKQRSKNSNLDRSVELALKESSDMEAPVPAHLVTLLTVKGICFKFVLD